MGRRAHFDKNDKGQETRQEATRISKGAKMETKKKTTIGTGLWVTIRGVFRCGGVAGSKLGVSGQTKGVEVSDKSVWLGAAVKIGGGESWECGDLR